MAGKSPAIALALCLAGCAIQPPTPLVDNTREYAEPYDAVWSAAVDTLTLDKLTITAIEKASGLIVATGPPVPTRQQWVECPMMGFGRWQPSDVTAIYTIRVRPDQPPGMQTVDLTLRLMSGNSPVTCPSTGALENRFFVNLASQIR